MLSQNLHASLCMLVSVTSLTTAHHDFENPMLFFHHIFDHAYPLQVACIPHGQVCSCLQRCCGLVLRILHNWFDDYIAAPFAVCRYASICGFGEEGQLNLFLVKLKVSTCAAAGTATGFCPLCTFPSKFSCWLYVCDKCCTLNVKNSSVT